MPASTGVAPMNQSSNEKNGWSEQIATSSRPVWARASLTAAVVTLEPFLANFTMSACGSMASRSSAVSLSIRDGRPKFEPFSIWAMAASLTARWP